MPPCRSIASRADGPRLVRLSALTLHVILRGQWACRVDRGDRLACGHRPAGQPPSERAGREPPRGPMAGTGVTRRWRVPAPEQNLDVLRKPVIRSGAGLVEAPWSRAGTRRASASVSSSGRPGPAAELGAARRMHAEDILSLTSEEQPGCMSSSARIVTCDGPSRSCAACRPFSLAALDRPSGLHRPPGVQAHLHRPARDRSVPQPLGIRASSPPSTV